MILPSPTGFPLQKVEVLVFLATPRLPRRARRPPPHAFPTCVFYRDSPSPKSSCAASYAAAGIPNDCESEFVRIYLPFPLSPLSFSFSGSCVIFSLFSFSFSSVSSRSVYELQMDLHHRPGKDCSRASTSATSSERYSFQKTLHGGECIRSRRWEVSAIRVTRGNFPERLRGVA